MFVLILIKFLAVICWYKYQVKCAYSHQGIMGVNMWEVFHNLYIYNVLFDNNYMAYIK